MTGFFGKIGYNLRSLLSFSGRESRADFWPYAIALYLLARAAQMLVTIPAMLDSMTRMMAGGMAHARHAKPGTLPDFPPEVIETVDRLNLWMASLDLLLVLLLAAACVRRLHDRDRTGLWFLMILPTRAFWLLSSGFGRAPPGALPDFSLLAFVLVAGLLFWGATILLLVFLAGEGTRGPNRFGPEPPV